MRRTIAFLTALILCLSFAACGGTGNKDHDYILHLLEQGEYDMAIHVIEGLKSGKTDTAQQQQSQASNERILELVPDNTGSNWRFEMELANDTGRYLTLEAIHITDYLNGEAGPTVSIEGNDRQIMYEDTGKPFVNVIFDDTSDLLDFVWKPAPKSLPDWSQLP